MFMGSKFKYKDAIKGWKTGIVKPETGERARLPYVGASRHEEEEMMQSFWDEKFAKFDYDVKLNLNDVKATVVDGKTHVHLDIDADLEKDELTKILKSIGL